MGTPERPKNSSGQIESHYLKYMSHFVSTRWDELVTEERRRDLYLKNRAVLLSDPEYVTQVLGIQIPLTEAYPWSYTLTEQIIQEQFLFEAFWDPVIAWSRTKAGEASEKVKNVAQSALQWGKELADTMTMLYKAFANPGAMMTYMKGLMRRAINPVKRLIYSFLDLLIDKGPGWGMPTFAQWATKMKRLIEGGLNKINQLQGWKKGLAFTTIALGLVWIKNKIGAQVQQILNLVQEKLGLVYDIAAAAWESRPGGAPVNEQAPGTDDPSVVQQLKAMIIKLVEGQVKDALEQVLNSAIGAASAAYGNVGEWVNKVKQIFGGLEFVKNALGGVVQFFADRGGMTLRSAAS